MATITGGPGNDTLNGDTDGNNNDSISGGGGDDLINGLTGNDTLNGDAGNDRLFGGVGNDVLFGGTGDDSLEGGVGNDTLDGGAGRDLIYGGDGDDYIFESDFLAGGNNSDSGRDTIYGGLGNDTVDFTGGTEGIAVVLVNQNAIVDPSGPNNNDSLFGIENIVGTAFNDTITGDDGANFLSGGAGADLVSGGGGSDTIAGGPGNDTLSGGAGIDTLTYANSATAVNVNIGANTATGEGTDVISGFENLIGSAQADTLAGSAGANIIDGGAGADTIFGGLGNDTITGGGGDDVITSGPPSPSTPSDLFLDWDAQPGGTGASLEAGFTQSVGGQINVGVSYTESSSGSSFSIDDGPSTGDAIPIFAPIDELPGGREFDPTSAGVLLRPGGSGSSTVTMNFAAVPGQGVANEVEDVYFRISDIDTGGFIDNVTILAYDAAGNLLPLSITTTSNILSINQASGTVTATGGNVAPSSALGSVLIYVAGPVASIVVQYGNLGNATTQGILLSDVHFTTIVADNDLVDGGAGNDSILAGFGNDTVYGGADNDTIQGEAGNDSLFGGEGDDDLFGGAGDDTISAGDGDDSIDGGSGDDTIFFGAGNDTVYGGDGNDLIDDVDGAQLAGFNLIYGGAGNDTIWSGDGDDLLYGDAGNDIISGENGNDTFFGGAGADTLSGGEGNDRFVVGLGDVDTLSGSEFVYGGGTNPSPAGDFDTIDLTAYGWSRVQIAYTGGDPTTESGIITLFEADGVTVLGTIIFEEIEVIIPCFTPGTMIVTDHGPVAVEKLAIGDLVQSRDNGFQPLRWVGKRKLSYVDLLANPDLQPVRIGQGAVDGAGPDRTMLVSPQHRVLIEDARAELLFGETEVLVAAKHLVGKAEITRVVPTEGVTYIHILFDRHEIVQSDGIWTESFQPAERMLSAMETAVRTEVLTLFPEISEDDDSYGGARLSLKAHEARVLLAS